MVEKKIKNICRGCIYNEVHMPLRKCNGYLQPAECAFCNGEHKVTKKQYKERRKEKLY